MATHSSILAWRIPRTEEPGKLSSMGLQRENLSDWADTPKPRDISVYFTAGNAQAIPAHPLLSSMGHSSYQPPGSVVMGVGNIQLAQGYQPLSACPTYTHTVRAFHGPTVGVLRLPDDPLFPLQSAHFFSYAEKKRVLKGTPSTLSPRGNGAAVGSEMELPEEGGETTASASPHLGTRWEYGHQVGIGRVTEGDAGITRRVDPKASQVESPWPHTASCTSLGARNPCLEPEGFCSKELDVEGPLP